jgi:hypothetical protein
MRLLTWFFFLSSSYQLISLMPLFKIKSLFLIQLPVGRESAPHPAFNIVTSMKF